ncbi:MAG TPA: hypothetical protein VKZ72_05465 [Acidimicrobiales bacterium]|nr:hypothetical protein [Acidimicrobiales bacterium]
MPVPDRYRRYEDAWHRAVETVHHRRLTDTLVKRQMMDVAERYNNAIVFPLHDVEGEPEFPALAAQIISDAVDGFATRANDTLPSLWAPAVDPTAQSHRRRAELRKEAWGATYYESHLPLRLAKGYRQLYGYGTFCLFVEPDHEAKRARIVTRDPMLTYPEPMGTDEIRAPRDIAFVYGRSPQHLKALYPEVAEFIDRHTTSDDDLWDVLEWQDAEHCFIGILGKRATQSYLRRYSATGQVLYGDHSMDQSFLLRAYPNRAGMVTAVCPAAVTLDRMIATVSRIIPHTDVLNKLAALDFIASEKAVFPHLVVLGENGQEPEIVGGQFHDGRTGKVNLVQNARTVQTLNLAPGPQTQVQMSNLERAARLSSGNPAVFQGESTGSIRSGQTVTQLASYSVDPRLKEAHRIIGYALEVINEAVAATELGYWPRRKYTVFSGWEGTNRHVTYRPVDIWTETRKSVVAYPMPGMDAQNATVAIAALNQARMLSRRTGMAKHPLVDNPDAEERALIEEALDDAIVMSGVQLVASGQMAWTDLARVRELVREGKMIEDAIAQAQQEAQERQATAAQGPIAPDQVLPPGAMPGLNAPEAGGQMALPPAEQGAPPSNPEQFEQVIAALMAAPPGGGPAGG